jgi:hypothetical protein
MLKRLLIIVSILTISTYAMAAVIKQGTGISFSASGSTLTISATGSGSGVSDHSLLTSSGTKTHAQLESSLISVGVSTEQIHQGLLSVGASTASIRQDLSSVGTSTAQIRQDLATEISDRQTADAGKLSTSSATATYLQKAEAAGLYLLSGGSITATAYCGPAGLPVTLNAGQGGLSLYTYNNSGALDITKNGSSMFSLKDDGTNWRFGSSVADDRGLGFYTNNTMRVYIDKDGRMFSNYQLSTTSSIVCRELIILQSTSAVTMTTYYELSRYGLNFIGWKSTDSLAANCIYTYPPAMPTADGQAWLAKTNGETYWGTVAATGVAVSTNMLVGNTIFLKDASNNNIVVVTPSSATFKSYFTLGFSTLMVSAIGFANGTFISAATTSSSGSSDNMGNCVATATVVLANTANPIQQSYDGGIWGTTGKKVTIKGGATGAATAVTLDAACGAGSYQDLVLSHTGLQVYYTMDGNVNDVKNALNGTKNGTIPYGEARIGPGAIQLYKSPSQYVSIPDNALIRPTTAISIEFWIYTSSGSDDGYLPNIYFKSTSNSCLDGYGASLLSNSSQILAWFNIQGAGTRIISNALAPYAWSHVAITYDKQNIKCYINGTLDQTQNYVANISTSAHDLWIGRDLGNDYIDAKIDEFAIYNVALDTQTIANHIAYAQSVRGAVAVSNSLGNPADLIVNGGITSGSIATLPTSGLGAGTFMFNTTDKNEYVSTEAVTTAGSWKKVTNAPVGFTQIQAGGATGSGASQVDFASNTWHNRAFTVEVDSTSSNYMGAMIGLVFIPDAIVISSITTTSKDGTSFTSTTEYFGKNVNPFTYAAASSTPIVSGIVAGTAGDYGGTLGSGIYINVPANSWIRVRGTAATGSTGGVARIVYQYAR